MSTTDLSPRIKWINAIILIVMSVLTIVSIKPWTAWDVPIDTPSYGWNRFSYFTVQSNLIATFTYLMAVTAILRNKVLGGWFRYLRGAAVLYMMVTGIIFALLLRNAEVNPAPGEFNWSNFILHELGPFFITVWWLLWPSRLPITWRGALCWLVFPFMWTIYTFARAGFTGWYPYPFLNPAKAGGLIGVGFYVAGIAVFFVILSQLLAWISRVRVKNNACFVDDIKP